jgi:hypothetical protein
VQRPKDVTSAIEGEDPSVGEPRGRPALAPRLSIRYAFGLTFRPLAVTARDTLKWHHAQVPEQQEALRAGLTPEREADVLLAWSARKGLPPGGFRRSWEVRARLAAARVAHVLHPFLSGEVPCQDVAGELDQVVGSPGPHAY